jgi:hypothetical protein
MDRDSARRRSGRHKKIVGLGDSSAHWYLASLAYEYKISPAELEKLDPRMLWTMGRVLESRNQRQRKR